MKKGIKLIATAITAILVAFGTVACGEDTSNSNSAVEIESFVEIATDENGEAVVSLYNRGTTGDNSIIVVENTDDIQIKGISEGAFTGNSEVKRVILPDTIYHIDRLAFRGCSSLEEINLPTSLSVIGEASFMATALKEVILPDSVTTIEEMAFANNISLEKLTINEGVTRLENITEGSTHLKELYLPSTITEISEDFTVSGSTTIYTPDNSVVTDYCEANEINYEII